MTCARELLDKFDYNPDTGIIIWRTGKRVGRAAGNKNKILGYVQIWLGNRKIYAHRIAWCIMTGAWPEHEIDHRNHDRSDNRWQNLRAATHSQNNFSRRFSRPERGIDKLPSGKFRARIRHTHIGVFDTAEEAAVAFRSAALQIFGEFSGAQQ